MRIGIFHMEVLYRHLHNILSHRFFPEDIGLLMTEKKCKKADNNTYDRNHLECQGKICSIIVREGHERIA